MREQIILAPGLDGTQLNRNMALHGVNHIGLRIVSAVELARLSLMRSGATITEDFVSLREETALVADALSKEAYFSKPSYTDICGIDAALRQIRSLVASGDEKNELECILSKSVFHEKNRALLHVLERYLDLLHEKNLLDATLLIRKAIEESSLIDADIITLSEYPLTPLERELLNKVSGGSVKERDLVSLFQTSDRPIHIDAYKNCYGAANEVESILEDIYVGKQLDRCLIAVTDAVSYSQIFFDYALLYDIPVTFGCGIPISNSNPARLLLLYYRWSTSGFFGAEAILQMLSSEAMDWKKLYHQLPKDQEDLSWNCFLEILKGLRLTNDPDVNRKIIETYRMAVSGNQEKLAYLSWLETVSKELTLPVEDFILKYSFIRRVNAAEKHPHPEKHPEEHPEKHPEKYPENHPGKHADGLVMKVDIAAAEMIHEELRVIRGAGIDYRPDVMIPYLMKQRVCAQRSEAGKLHITRVEDAFASVREHIYIAGMSASNFPGSPRENYLLLDDDLKQFGPEADIYTADGVIRIKRERLLALAKLAAALGAGIKVSYCGMNVSELKKDNPSSLIFELLRSEYGTDISSEEIEAHIQKVEYFEPAISAGRLVGDAYTKGHRIKIGSSEASVPGRAGSSEQDATQSHTQGAVQSHAQDADQSLTQGTTQSHTQGAVQSHAQDADQSLTQGTTQSCTQGAVQGTTQDVAQPSWYLEKAWSPTALDTFFSCPRRFMLRYLMNIPEPEDYDPFQVMNVLETGTLAHSLMETLGNSDMNADEFHNLCSREFDCFLAQHPPLIAENVPGVKEQFLDMMETAYEMDPHREIVAAEEDIRCVHESGVSIHGFPDRVEKMDDGGVLIVDFKTGRVRSHVEDDIATCLQVVIYAYLMEQSGVRVSNCEYRYIRLGETVTCRYDDDMKQKLNNLLKEFKESLENGYFPAACTGEGGWDNCKFCKYESLCQNLGTEDMITPDDDLGEDQVKTDSAAAQTKTEQTLFKDRPVDTDQAQRGDI